MSHSEQINELAAALAKAQGLMQNAATNRVNPHFRSKYADLSSVLDTIREPLSSCGLSITQTIGLGPVCLVTTLLHSSGQYIASYYPLPDTHKPHEMGSALTYARRYSITAIVGIAADDDDDGSAASKSNAPPPPNPSKQQFMTECKAKIAALDGVALQDWWRSEEQMKARRDFDLDANEVSELKSLVIIKLNLKNDSGQP